MGAPGMTPDLMVTQNVSPPLCYNAEGKRRLLDAGDLLGAMANDFMMQWYVGEFAANDPCDEWSVSC